MCNIQHAMYNTVNTQHAMCNFSVVHIIRDVDRQCGPVLIAYYATWIAVRTCKVPAQFTMGDGELFNDDFYGFCTRILLAVMVILAWFSYHYSTKIRGSNENVVRLQTEALWSKSEWTDRQSIIAKLATSNPAIWWCWVSGVSFHCKLSFHIQNAPLRFTIGCWRKNSYNSVSIDNIW